MKGIKKLKTVITGCCFILVAGCVGIHQNSRVSDIYTSNKTTEMTNSANGRTPTISQVSNPTVYYANRVTALKLVREGKWLLARPILEELTTQYQDDGDTWYLLGLTYLQEQQ